LGDGPAGLSAAYQLLGPVLFGEITLKDGRVEQSNFDNCRALRANPFVAAERGYIDEVIMPHGTRKRIARALQMLRNKHVENPWKKHDNIPL